MAVRRAGQHNAEGEVEVPEVVTFIEFSGEDKDIKKASKVYRGALLNGVYVPNSLLDKLGNPSSLEVTFRPRV